MPVLIHYNITSYTAPDDNQVIEFLNHVIEEENRHVGDINIIYTSNKEILELNRKYLNHDYYTDIITFDYVEGETIHGDAFISLDKIDENATEYGTSFYNELIRVVLHGVLHLIGYGDKTDDEIRIMRSKENYYLDQFYLKK